MGEKTTDRVPAKEFDEGRRFIYSRNESEELIIWISYGIERRSSKMYAGCSGPS